ncbi:uncharacterized protein LOC135388547 isoform X1 [Ornithodoros turicata]|uniref:uncharacterized protein LOC135388547 isoform X1 n=1 Tax=Ornithodoros turicata TaxID=34597 RepID=UPI003138985F
MENPKRRKNGTYCCVVGCHNSQVSVRGKQPAIKFYCFPTKWYEKERPRQWIAAVRRVNPDGTAWEPSPTTLICSAHFVGNTKSADQAHPAYVPTVFPAVYKGKSTAGLAPIERYARSKRRAMSHSIVTEHVTETVTAASDLCMQEMNSYDDCELPDGKVACQHSSVETQTDDSCLGTTTLFSMFTCKILENTASTQVSHASQTETGVQAMPETKSDASGPTERVCIFQGYENVRNDVATLQDLCGVSPQGFALLFSLLTSFRVRVVDVTVLNKLLCF